MHVIKHCFKALLEIAQHCHTRSTAWTALEMNIQEKLEDGPEVHSLNPVPYHVQMAGLLQVCQAIPVTHASPRRDLQALSDL